MLARTVYALAASASASASASAATSPSTSNSPTNEDFVITKAKRQELRKIMKLGTTVLRKSKIKKAAAFYVLLIDEEKKIF